MRRDAVKLQGYDSFRCAAGSCPLTCCGGWDIQVEKEKKLQWESQKALAAFTRGLAAPCEDEYRINKEVEDYCPMLSSEGLCRLVLEFGDDKLPSICQEFPRLCQVNGKRQEYSLSPACPEVVRLLGEWTKPAEYVTDAGENYDPEALKGEVLRLLSENGDGLSLEGRLLKIFERLAEEKNSRGHFKLGELNQLFLDMTENYRRVPLFEPWLDSLYQTACADWEGSWWEKMWEEFESRFSQMDLWMENCIAAKLWGMEEPPEEEEPEKEMQLNLQIVVLEYLMTKFSLFLRFLERGGRLASKEEVSVYMAIFSRALGNNQDAVLDYMEECFGDALWSLEYARTCLNP